MSDEPEMEGDYRKPPIHEQILISVGCFILASIIIPLFSFVIFFVEQGGIFWISLLLILIYLFARWICPPKRNENTNLPPYASDQFRNFARNLAIVCVIFLIVQIYLNAVFPEPSEYHEKPYEHDAEYVRRFSQAETIAKTVADLLQHGILAFAGLGLLLFILGKTNFLKPISISQGLFARMATYLSFATLFTFVAATPNNKVRDEASGPIRVQIARNLDAIAKAREEAAVNHFIRKAAVENQSENRELVDQIVQFFVDGQTICAEKNQQFSEMDADGSSNRTLCYAPDMKRAQRRVIIGKEAAMYRPLSLYYDLPFSKIASAERQAENERFRSGSLPSDRINRSAWIPDFSDLLIAPRSTGPSRSEIQPQELRNIKSSELPRTIDNTQIALSAAVAEREASRQLASEAISSIISPAYRSDAMTNLVLGAITDAVVERIVQTEHSRIERTILGAVKSGSRFVTRVVGERRLAEIFGSEIPIDALARNLLNKPREFAERVFHFRHPRTRTSEQMQSLKDMYAARSRARSTGGQYRPEGWRGKPRPRPRSR